MSTLPPKVALGEALRSYGWSAADSLAKWLNRKDDPILARAYAQLKRASPLEVAQRRVLIAISLLRAIDALPRGKESVVKEPERFEMLRAQLLRTFSRVPLFWNLWHAPRGHWYVSQARGVSATTEPLWWLSEVSRCDLLERLRRCKKKGCRKWFVAKGHKKDFCSSVCQQEFWEDYRKTPEGRKEQAARMRGWRAKQRQKKTHSERKRS